MNVNAQKLELIEWILKLGDAGAIREIMKIKEIASHRKPQMNTRKFGGGKHIFTYVAEDFDEPLDDFREYMK
jgi:hypothetical protein